MNPNLWFLDLRCYWSLVEFKFGFRISDSRFPRFWTSKTNPDSWTLYLMSEVQNLVSRFGDYDHRTGIERIDGIDTGSFSSRMASNGPHNYVVMNCEILRCRNWPQIPTAWITRSHASIVDQDRSHDAWIMDY